MWKLVEGYNGYYNLQYQYITAPLQKLVFLYAIWYKCMQKEAARGTNRSALSLYDHRQSFRHSHPHFEGNALDFYYSIVYLPKDPLLPWQREVLAIPEHVGYYVTPQFHYYCVVNAGNIKLVVGPARQIRESEQELRALAFQLDLAGEEADALIAGVRSIVRMPVESVLQMLCTMNYVLNGEKLELQDISIYEQKKILERYCREHGITAYRHYDEDDGYSGTNFAGVR